jgi:hypothetical protein
MKFKEVIANLKKNKEVRLSGKLLGLPWPDLPKLNKVVPGIQKGRYYGVTANQKVGKSMLANFLFVYQPIKFALKNPHVKLKIIYFSLELSEEELKRQVLSNILSTNHKQFIDPQNLASMFNDYVVEDTIFSTLGEEQEYLDFVDNTLDIVTNVRNPFGMYKYVRNFARSRGKFYLDGVEVNPELNGGLFDKYVPNDSDEHVIVITDHIGLLTNEKGEDKYATIDKWSGTYCLMMRDRYNYSVVDIQQQTALSEQQQFTLKGETIVAKLRPSADCLADNKSTSRNFNLLFGLFSPARYNIMKYPDNVPENQKFDISILNDNYRELSILLNRNGVSNASLDLLFDGACCTFKELPLPNSELYVNFKEWKKSHVLV